MFCVLTIRQVRIKYVASTLQLFNPARQQLIPCCTIYQQTLKMVLVFQNSDGSIDSVVSKYQYSNRTGPVVEQEVRVCFTQETVARIEQSGDTKEWQLPRDYFGFSGCR